MLQMHPVSTEKRRDLFKRKKKGKESRLPKVIPYLAVRIRQVKW